MRKGKGKGKGVKVGLNEQNRSFRRPSDDQKPERFLEWR